MRRWELKFNETLPPVGCPLLVYLGWGCVAIGERTGHITNKNAGYEVRFADGSTMIRRWKWTYP